MEYAPNDFNNSNQIDQYLKALKNLELELQKKEYEISRINNSYQELKKLIIKLSKESENLNEKNIALIKEKRELEQKYELEIDTLNTNFKKKKKIIKIRFQTFLLLIQIVSKIK